MHVGRGEVDGKGKKKVRKKENPELQEYFSLFLGGSVNMENKSHPIFSLLIIEGFFLAHA